MAASHNISEMVSKQMSETENRSDPTHSHRVETPLESIEQQAYALVKAGVGGIGREAAAYDLTPMELAVVRLFLTDLEWTATELAQMISVGASTMSRVVNKLVDSGVQSRCRPREDRRLVFLKLTEEGVALCFELREKAHSYDKILTRGISAEDLETYLATIRRIMANHAALEESNSGPGMAVRISRGGGWRPIDRIQAIADCAAVAPGNVKCQCFQQPCSSQFLKDCSARAFDMDGDDIHVVELLMAN